METSWAKQLAKKWQPFVHITPSAVLVLFWNYLIHFTGSFVDEVAPATWYNFTANVIQYNIDQLVGVSADELNSVIYWHILSEPFVNLTFFATECFYVHKYFYWASFIASGVSVSLVLVSHSFFKHKLENISLIKNPIKLIVRVLCYARKHKYPENRSALTYWEEEAPSRLDLGKDKYGGPFTEEEVEDVKTVFRILPLFIGFVAIIFSNDYYWSADKSFTLPTCLTVTDSQVCFYKYIPSMLTRMSVGIFLAFIVTVSKVIIFVIERSHPDINDFVSLEFTVAQSPVHMRGVMVGLWYATSWGLGHLINIIVKFPFDCESQYICTSFYYYITKSVLVLIILIVFVILAKRYKYRVRENEVNIVQIADDHYQRYINQREQFGSDTEILVLVWNYLMYAQYVLMSRFIDGSSTEVAPATWYKYGFAIMACFGCCFFPFLGLLADVWIGRYNWYSIVFIAWIIMGIGFIVGNFFDSEAILYSVYGFAYLFQFSASGVSVSLVLVSRSFFKHKLKNISLIKNPIKLIVRVLCYARKHKYPENRSALTYWDKEAPSRLDLGKDKYGGPFTEEEVEDVKTVFRMLPLFIGFVTVNRISKVIIFVIERSHLGINNFGKLLFIPETIQGFTFVLLHPVSLEFTVAQSPVHMRGVMVGLWYVVTSYGLVFVILAKRYKYRVRENEVNIVQIVDAHCQRYLNQREQFGSDTDSYSSILVTIFAMKFARKCQPFLHLTPSAVLVLVWNYLIHFTGRFVNEVAPATWYNFSANIIQYNIDQLVGASADELNSVIYWHILSEPLVAFIFYAAECFYYASGVSVSFVLVSHSFLKHKLENISLIKNPIKLIVRVLCYTRKHKYPENRSALTYWEEEAPSRLDLVSLEFTVAQSPVHMRGVMVGLWYASWGIGLFLNITLKFPFDCESHYICTSFYYYITKSVLVLIILIVFVILAKRYKYRVRENEVNIVQIVDDHYQRYMEQREQFMSGIDSDSSNVTSELMPFSDYW
uniref:Uncharacterized protein n=1 Tax=Amphimedon queenslandica TaxID=400682 RepID=A0A1X7U2D4_AMPQE